MPKTSLFPVDQMSLDYLHSKDFSTDTMTVAMMPAANPIVQRGILYYCKMHGWKGRQNKAYNQPTARA